VNSGAARARQGTSEAASPASRTVDNAVAGLAQKALHLGIESIPGAAWGTWSKLARTVKCASLGARIAHTLRGVGPVRRRRSSAARRGRGGPSDRRGEETHPPAWSSRVRRHAGARVESRLQKSVNAHLVSSSRRGSAMPERATPERERHSTLQGPREVASGGRSSRQGDTAKAGERV
jgi:hypothetical protein